MDLTLDSSLMKMRAFGWVMITALLTAAILVGAPGRFVASAAGEEPPGPDRFTIMLVDTIVTEWWMIAWEDSEVDCRLRVEHYGIPTGDEIYASCGEDLYDLWWQTPACEPAVDGGSTSECSGYYFLEYSSGVYQKEIGVALPAAEVWVTLPDCIYEDSTNKCSQVPLLTLVGEEPLPNETITQIHVLVGEDEYLCGPVCQIELAATDPAGLDISFWADSSYGDTTLVFDARVRVAQFGNTDAGELMWYVDVLSSQWRGAPSAGCAETWGLFPPVGGPPRWLSTPNYASQLASDIPLDYLAGNLIAQGLVDVSACQGEALLPSGAATECGVTVARPAMVEWQNQFDDLIFDAARASGVPAQLLKNLFGRESQFWPGVFTAKSDIGLGQLTENGADTTLLWNQSFFEQFCPFVLDETSCQKGYTFLAEEDQLMLRGALVHSVDAVCPDCPLGIDLRQADFSIAIFAETLLANCDQAAYIIEDVSGVPTDQISNYEDMWRFSLVNYNAGPGCLKLALEATLDAGEPLQWGFVKSHLTPVCINAADYVDDISR